MHILVPYASVHGSTAEIAEFMGKVLSQHHLTTTVAPVDTVDDISPYDVIMPGSPVHGGLWITSMLLFLRRQQSQLQKKVVFPWLTCIRVIEPGGYDHIIHNYIPREVLNLPLMMGVGVFAGKLDINTIDMKEHWTLALRYDGDRMNQMEGDFRDWNKIRAWTMSVVDKLNFSVPPVYNKAP